MTDLCPKCRGPLGWFGKWLHKCKPDRILVDREGVAYLPTREVKLKANQKRRP